VIGKKLMKISIRNAITESAEILSAAGLAEPRMEATSILSHVLCRDRTFIIGHAEDLLADGQLEAFQQFVRRRANGEPLQYITGHQEFFKLGFEVTPDVLIPRPETEIIVEAALEVSQNDHAPVILDLGTGSGCIAVSLLHELADARAIATDVSFSALRVAQRNAQRHGVIDRLAFTQADGSSVIGADGRFTLVVSNPPYVPESEIESLQREVRDHEPLSALVSGADGLSHIRALVRGVPILLRPGGYFIFEIGFGQREAVAQLVDSNLWDLIEIRNDLQNIPRTFVLQKR